MFDDIGRRTERHYGSHRMWSDDPSRAFRRYGGMRFYVLWLLRSKGMKGSEIINEIESQTMGWWRPSPGTIYPLLSNLEKDGLISRDQDLRYTLTEKARSEFFHRTPEDTGEKRESTLSRTIRELDACVTLLEDEKEKVGEVQKEVSDIVDRLERLLGRGGSATHD